MSPLLKLLYRLTVVKPTVGYTVSSSDPYSVVELPPKSLMVRGMKSPPSCQVQVPACILVE